jgi:hypothetical protein
MKFIISFFIFLNLLFADSTHTMYNLYQNGKYEQACDIGFKKFYKYKKDENFLSLYAFSCLNADNLNRLSLPIIYLQSSQEARANAAYFSIILMQKKLLYHALIDGYDLKSLNLPSTDYVLSKVFNLYSKLDKYDQSEFYLLQDKENERLTYKLYLIEDKNFYKIVIEEIYDTIVVKRHVYW